MRVCVSCRSTHTTHVYTRDRDANEIVQKRWKRQRTRFCRIELQFEHHGLDARIHAQTPHADILISNACFAVCALFNRFYEAGIFGSFRLVSSEKKEKNAIKLGVIAFHSLSRIEQIEFLDKTILFLFNIL